MSTHFRDEPAKEIKAWMRTIETWPLWVHIDDSVFVYTTAEITDIIFRDPELGGVIVRGAKLCYDGADLIDALRVWWPDLK